MQLVGVRELFNVELGSEGSRHRVAVVTLSVAVVIAILIEQTEERGKGGAGFGDETSLEERHVARCVGDDGSFRNWRSSWKSSCS